MRIFHTFALERCDDYAWDEDYPELYDESDIDQREYELDLIERQRWE